jgi:hypothetical protein
MFSESTCSGAADLKSKNPKTSQLARCENIIKMIKATLWVLVFAKTQKPNVKKLLK